MVDVAALIDSPMVSYSDEMVRIFLQLRACEVACLESSSTWCEVHLLFLQQSSWAAGYPDIMRLPNVVVTVDFWMNTLLWKSMLNLRRERTILYQGSKISITDPWRFSFNVLAFRVVNHLAWTPPYWFQLHVYFGGFCGCLVKASMGWEECARGLHVFCWFCSWGSSGWPWIGQLYEMLRRSMHRRWMILSLKLLSWCQ